MVEHMPAPSLPIPPAELMGLARQLRRDFERIQIEHEFAIEAVLTKISILRKEFLRLHHYNPIEHVTSRLKSPESILKKIIRLEIDPTPEAVRAGLHDIAGVRITCSFIADTYRVMEALTSQADVTVRQVKDYIKNPKPNGYKSLHVIVEVPVYLSTGPVPVSVEVRIRTIAMDFWASLEHKINYKYEGRVPEHLADSLKRAALRSEELDREMEQLYEEVQGSQAREPGQQDIIFPEDLLAKFWQSMPHPEVEQE